MKKLPLITALFAVSLVGCSNEEPNNTNNTNSNNNGSSSTNSASPVVISTVTNQFPSEFSTASDAGFAHYVKIAPNSATTLRSNNSNAIHIIATDDDANNLKIQRAAMIFQHLLTDLPNSKYGKSKSDILNTLTSRNATLILTKNDDENEEMLLKLFINEAFRQGKLREWVDSSSAPNTSSIKTNSVADFLNSFESYANAYPGEDENVSETLLRKVLTSPNTQQWLLNSQSLMYRELTVEGDCHYMSNFASYCSNLGTHADRDAAFEEILHLTQAQGIAPNASTKQYQHDVAQRAEALYQDKLDGKNPVWRPTESSWNDWKTDDVNPEIGPSSSHEYLAAVFEAYMGMWQHKSEGLDGYQAVTRKDIETQDPQGHEWISGMFHGYLQYTANIDSEGVKTYYDHAFKNLDAQPTFRMMPNESGTVENYTYKSQWLTNVKIVGNQSIDLIANDQDNRIEGNHTNNVIYGKGGKDTYVVDANSTQCKVVDTSKSDSVSCSGIGKDTLYDIEQIQFKDKLLILN